MTLYGQITFLIDKIAPYNCSATSYTITTFFTHSGIEVLNGLMVGRSLL